MTLDDIGAFSELRLKWVNAHKVLSELKRESCIVYMHMNGHDLGASAGVERELIRQAALIVWQRYVDDLRAKLMLLGVNMEGH